jgi:hypothetical protein
LTLTPASGGAPMTLKVGPAIERGAVQALAAAGTKARVFYHEEASPTAAKVQAAPTKEDGAKTYDGQVAKVSDSSITVAGDDGEKTFEIRAEDRPSFETNHLKEHQAENAPVRIYFLTDGSGDYAVAYEDA